MISKLHFISQETIEFNHLQIIEKACKAGINWVQLRIKDKPLNEVIHIAESAKDICDSYNAKLIVNDHPYVAKVVNAYGLHLGKDDMAVADARKIVGDDMIIGATANTLQDLVTAAQNGADYIGLGPFRFTRTKFNLSPVLGLDGYYSIINQVKKLKINIPIIAIGGIEQVDIPLIMKTGVHGIAVSSLIVFAEHPEQEVQGILEVLEQENYVKDSR